MKWFERVTVWMLIASMFLTVGIVPANAKTVDGLGLSTEGALVGGCKNNVLSSQIQKMVEAEEEERVCRDVVPLYFQTDYPDTPYGGGTVATSGCGITSVAMVASFFSSEDYFPDDLAERFGGVKGNNMERMEYASDALGLPLKEKTYDWHVVVDALDHGEIAIAMVDANSVFTDSQHFIVLTGITDEGKIMVNDPNEANYFSSKLKDGFENGFDQESISDGFSGGWIYDCPKREVAQTASNETKETPAEVAEDEEIILKDYGTVPPYFQTDYPDVRYSYGTIATSGCSVTCVAMVATYLTGYDYMPDQLAEYFSEFSGNNMQRLEYMSDELQLPWEKAGNAHDAFQALRDGKVVIALMNENSLFTNSQHFIVLAGLKDSGKIMVNDPNEANYSHWQLKKAFIRGFDEDDIMTGYSGGWIYDPAAMPEEPFIYIEEEVYVEPRYPGIELTEGEELLARMVWCEAQGESFEGQQAVAEVVLNRLFSGEFQGSIRRIIYAEDQFNSVPYLDDAEPTQTQYEAIERALYGPYVLPIDVFYFGRQAVNDNVWGKIGGHIFCYGEG